MDIEGLQSYCKKLQGVTESIKWDHDLCFSIGGKMFCVMNLSGNLKVSLKVDDEEFDKLCSREGIIPAPYLARHKWIQVERSGFSRREWEHHICQSYELVKEKLPMSVKKNLGFET